MDENEYGTGYDELTYNSDSNDRSADEVFEDFLSQLDKKERERIERQVATREKVNEAKEKVGGFFAKYTDAAKTGKDALDASKELRRARQEMVVAKTNGCDTKDIERSLAKYELANSEYEKAAERFQDAKVRILEPVTSRFGKAAQSVTDAFDKVGSWIDDKRASVVAAVTNIKEAIAEANGRFATQRDTAYLGLSEKVASIDRAWMQFNYGIDKNISNTLDAVHKTISTLDEKVQATKAIWLKDEGKDAVAKNTPDKKSILSAIKSLSDEYKSEMADLKRDFEFSKERSVYQMKSNQELRQSYGLRESASLSENIKKARDAAIDKAASRAGKAPEKNNDGPVK